MILELKSVEQLNKIHRKQLLVELKLKEIKLGILRLINGLEDEALEIFGYLREPNKRGQPDGSTNSIPLRTTEWHSL